MERQQNDTSRPIPFLMYLEGTNTLATGKAVTITLCKPDELTIGPGAGELIELGSGAYRYLQTADEMNILGDVLLFADASGCDTTPILVTVVNHNPLELASSDRDFIAFTELRKPESYTGSKSILYEGIETSYNLLLTGRTVALDFRQKNKVYNFPASSIEAIDDLWDIHVPIIRPSRFSTGFYTGSLNIYDDLVKTASLGKIVVVVSEK